MIKEGLVRMSRKKKPEGAESLVGAQPVMAQDQNEILDEVGAELDPETNELLADEDSVRAIGAVDVDSVRENRRMKEHIDKKRGGAKKITFNTNDVLQRYELVIATYPPNTIDISVRRLTGTPVQYVIVSRPRSAAELYEAIKTQVHKECEEASYELKFIDTNRKEWRGTGHITMPDTRPVGGPPVNQFYSPQVPTPGFPPGYQPPPAAAPVAAAPQPDMVQTVGQLFELFQRMMPAPQTPAAAPAAPAPVYTMPAPAPGEAQSPIAMVTQAFEMFQRMQQGGQQAGVSAPVAPAPVAADPGTPPVQPPPGTMYVPGFGYVPIVQLMQAIGAIPPPAPPEPVRSPRPYRDPPPYARDPRDPRGGYAPRDPYDDPRAPYDPRSVEPRRSYDPRAAHYDPRGYPSAPQAPARPRSPADELRESLGVLRTVTETMREFQSILPGSAQPQAQQQAAASADDDEEGDNGPLQVIDVGGAKLLVDRETGDPSYIATIGANVPGAAKWIAEQMQSWSKTATERQQHQPRVQQTPRRQLPAGYVEVTEGYRPPPGFFAVPVDDLPPPPQHMPPPIRQQTAPPEPERSDIGPPPMQPPWGPQQTAEPEPEDDFQQEGD